MKSIYRVAMCTALVATLLFWTQTRRAQSAQAPAQTAAPIRSESHAVLISVAVRDATGKSVDNLRKEDFTITDNGKPRDFQLFPGDNSSGGAHPPILEAGYYSNRYAA